MKIPRIKTWILVVLVGAAAFWAGRRLAAPLATPAGDGGHAEGEAMAKPEPGTESLWTCPMHPQIRLPEPGKCPICGMDLVPLEQGAHESSPRELSMSEDARKLAEIETAPVERRAATKEVRLVGKVAFDEGRVRTVASWIPGKNRLERLYVDYTGVPVQKGEHLVSLYSPTLLTAQEELLEAHRRVETTEGERSPFLAESNQKAYASAREKLLLWGLTEEQVDEIEHRGTADDHMMITSPVSGIVIEKALDEGAYVDVGTRIYQIADLDHLWILLDAYEQDLSWIRYGQEVSIQAEALPGEVFEGWISFLDPVLDERTRTVTVRVNIDNLERKLRPGMFVRAVVQSHLARGGQVMDPSLAGKWISPMHPEIVKDHPGKCDICGMDLVPAEQLAFVDLDDPAAQPLVIPATAVLLTGRRAVVYVEVEGREQPTYEGREIVLGPRAGDVYIVLDGLEEGERVVVHGAFKIDSSLQIQARPSMMSMGAEPFHGRRSALFRQSLDPLYAAYLSLEEHLAEDEEEPARESLRALQEALDKALPADLEPAARAAWEGPALALRNELDGLDPASLGLDALRESFARISEAVLELDHVFGHSGQEAHYEAHCPMAFGGRGASWLQRGPAIRNPYFGHRMYSCGEIRHALPGLGGAAESADPDMPPPDGEGER
jgi:Cu(I)/Ag(I) efflux system membrane fusion protein